MDAERFDDLVVSLSSRRTVLGGLLAGLLLAGNASARGKNGKRRKGNVRGKGKGKNRQRAFAQADSCWRAGACIPKQRANVSQCDLASYTAPAELDCTRCNLSRANLHGANFSGVNFTRANFSNACLVDADFNGATFANTTNVYGAIFCRTIMPDGSTNNSGCDAPTACCPTCLQAGESCGPGIGGECCGEGRCINGMCTVCETCASLGNVCGEAADGCGDTLTCLCGTSDAPSCLSGACTTCAAVCGESCSCANLIDGSTQCFQEGEYVCPGGCATNAECPEGWLCVSTYTEGDTNETVSFPQLCGSTAAGVCLLATLCSAG